MAWRRVLSNFVKTTPRVWQEGLRAPMLGPAWKGLNQCPITSIAWPLSIRLVFEIDTATSNKCLLLTARLLRNISESSIESNCYPVWHADIICYYATQPDTRFYFRPYVWWPPSKGIRPLSPSRKKRLWHKPALKKCGVQSEWLYGPRLVNTPGAVTQALPRGFQVTENKCGKVCSQTYGREKGSNR